jgi:hypothetical protein
VQRLLEAIQTDIHGAAREAMRTHIYHYKGSNPAAEADWEELRGKAERGIISVPLCDDERCGTMLEEQLGVSVLGLPVVENDAGEQASCMICGRKGARVYVARPY